MQNVESKNNESQTIGNLTINLVEDEKIIIELPDGRLINVCHAVTDLKRNVKLRFAADRDIKIYRRKKNV